MSARREITPRGLRRVEAASYVGVSPSTFDEMVRVGDMPEGFLWRSIRLWDVQDLDVYFTLLKGTTKQPVYEW